MRKIVLGAMMLAMVPTMGKARGYYDTEGDWVIAGAGEGNNLGCIMSSQRPTDSSFLYMLIAGPGPAEWRVGFSSKVASAPGPIDAVITAGSSEPMKLKGIVAKDSITFKLKGDIRSNQTQRVRDAISEESTLKITLNRKGIPSDTLTVSLAGASDALLSMTKCVRRLGGLDD